MFFQNRGMYLESIINYTIEFYNNERKALIFKSCPKIIINQGKYYFLNQSTVDYHGVYQGKYLCFEAKTTEQTILPWKNIKLHQWNFLLLAYKQQAISFIIIYFTIYEKYYLVFIKELLPLKQGKLTITFEWIKKNGYEIQLISPFLLDFIKIL
ncbi:Holliday junction resolvase RecU [Spiroplasma platyhelix]|uniref:Holliday junction resolvase RecU n=1 Tax=Spiroplasma platyhelix PALS-1 TaxID=1276218 RepID=A0A846TPU8_9MOLU|nr:Holliday junction resolvase RecU [Spiroplasma platyhelix]MBE4703937.1 Holliday junction resolvase RecU [Spiroplasma platyhelix PALS-1]NKE38310.1 Holliday junction resolvase RecU [Spiroplasma platyhelix PALS-1]UJB29195.1 Holliday junction-specific endonuclease [Spiroplasma platyhelix PALS-1]